MSARSSGAIRLRTAGRERTPSCCISLLALQRAVRARADAERTARTRRRPGRCWAGLTQRSS